jgi:endonuclease/exonuclease/phosphatase family metal-dependent hydrolase
MLVHLGRLRVVGNNVDRPHQITHRGGLVLWENQKQTRICAQLTVTAGGRRVHLFNTHLSLPSPFMREFWASREKMGYGPNQLREAEALASFVRENSGGDPFFVCGDFNSAPGSPVYRFLTREAGFSGAQEALGLIDLGAPKAFPTAGVARLRMHLDHFFGAPAVEWLDMDGTRPYGDKVSPFHGLSDHVPLIVRARV